MKKQTTSMISVKIDYSTIHPDDEKTINFLNKIPGFKSFLNKTVGTVRES